MLPVCAKRRLFSSNSFATLAAFVEVCTLLNAFSLHFNGHFSGEPGLAGVY